MPTSDRNHLEAEILRLAKSFAGVPPPQQRWEEFDSFILSAAQGGLRRGDICDLVVSVMRKNREDLAEESYDALGDYLSGLTGDCAGECWVRLPGPTDPREFADYVSGRVWMKGWRECADQVESLREELRQKRITHDEFQAARHALVSKYQL